MGTAKSGDSELIRVTLIDYFSSEILVDNLVYPDVAMEHYNTRFSGVTRKEMENALTLGQCLMGKSKAREAVWRFVGPHTIVVGHSANNDLTAMRWIHTVMVDTYLIESKKKKAKEEEAKEKKAKEEKANEEKANEEKANEEKAKTVAKRDGKEREVQESEQHKEKPKKKVKGSGALSLKTLTRERLRREIQTAGRNGHDSLEDVIATRDLAHWNVLNEIFVGEKL
jgi:RNA exonuclease 1